MLKIVSALMNARMRARVARRSSRPAASHGRGQDRRAWRALSREGFNAHAGTKELLDGGEDIGGGIGVRAHRWTLMRGTYRVKG